MDYIDRGFRVAHQKVSIDVDLANNSICGWTELTIIPTDALLKQIVLDCRHSQIHNVLINGKKATFNHSDSLHDTNMPSSTSVSQHHLYSKQIDGLLKGTLPGELTIQLPKGIKIVPQEDGGSTLISRTSPDMIICQPLTLKIDFSSYGSSSGFRFVGGLKSNLKRQFWHAYSTHDPIGQSTSSWLPCVDGLWELSTWELEVSVPQSVKVKEKKEVENNNQNGNGNLINDNEQIQNDDNNDNDNDNEDEDEEIEIVVICNNVTPNEITHPFDPSKKVTTFQLFNSISAHHVGFVVGPFVKTPIVDLKKSEDDDNSEEQGSNSIPLAVYSFPDKIIEAKNTCIFLYKAMEFFSREYGSYPFSTFSLCFVSDCSVEISTAASLAVCSDKLLFPPELIEPLFNTTESLTNALAAQWCGVNIVPRTWNDLWVTVGISHYMTNLFLKRLLGNNEYRFRLKSRADEICEKDIAKPPIGNPNFSFPISEKDLSFIRLKSPMVLFILDRRMTKTDRSLGLSRVLPKLFLQSMSGDLNSCLSTSHFIKLCERVSHGRLESFFEQWVFGCGYPIFRVTQRFNKKRMFIEMGISQVQSNELDNKKVNVDTFLYDANKHLEDQNERGGGVEYPIQPIFTGPMTIRIHEADGTPYEHVVDLKDSFTKLDIQYNTKYKRLKRNQKGNTNTTKSEHIEIDDEDDSNNGVLLHCLGDVLQSDREIQEWRLSDWGKDEEERMYNEAFEWMRVDSDFEWICKIYINQPDYMYVSQLQQDRDVVAQYEAVTFFGDLKPSKLYSTILVRTLMDKRYYYGVRIKAAVALINMAIEEVDYIGKYHLLKAFQESFCFEGSTIPSANNFNDFPTYFVQKALIHAISKITDSSGNCPLDVKTFLLDLLRYNENSSNQFSDCFYICELIQSIVDSLKGGVNRVGGLNNKSKFDYESKKFLTQAVTEIERCQRMDRWIPSFQNMITIECIRQKRSLAWHGFIQMDIEDLVYYTKPGNNNDVRLEAFESLMSSGGLKNDSIVQYIIYLIINEVPYVQNGLIETLGRVISKMALEKEGQEGGGNESEQNGGGGLTIVESGIDSLNERKEALARTTISGAIDMIRKAFKEGDGSKDSKDNYKTFREGIWAALTSVKVDGILEKKTLLEICRVLYEPLNSYMVTLPIPRTDKLIAKRVGESLIVIKRKKQMKAKIVLLTTGGTTTVVQPQPETNGNSLNDNHVKSEPITSDLIKPTTTPEVIKRKYKRKSDIVKTEPGQSRMFTIKIPSHAKELQAAAASAAMPYTLPPSQTPEPKSKVPKPNKVRLKLKI